LQNEIDIENLKPFSSGFIIGKIVEKPLTIIGGHVFFSLTKDGCILQCAVYKPTGLTTIASELIPGDIVRIGGGIRKSSKKHQRILNIEFLEIIDLKKAFVMVNPLCNRCKKRMKSKGKNQGYQCIKCGNTQSIKIKQEIPRKIQKQFYLPPPSAHRHLTRPMQRMNKMVF
jgi:tRNA(Ile2)-agmatinylcytidine synthase